MSMRGKFIKYSFVLLLSLVSVLVFQQSSAEKKKQSLEKQREKLEEEIALTNKLIKENKKKKGSIVHELNLLNTLILQRDLLIKKLTNDREDLDIAIKEKTASIAKNRDKLTERRQEYAKLIYVAYKNRDANMDLMYLLASESFSQLYARYEYLAQYRENRLSSIKEIERLVRIINEEIAGLEQERLKIVELQKRILDERKTLLRDRRLMDSKVANLSTEELSLKSELDEKSREMKEIENLIAIEVKKIIEEEASGKNYDKVLAENKIVSDNFKENKGRLPWPTAKGIVTCKFGGYNVADRRNLQAVNLGIDISTVPGSKARAVFDGVVTRIAGIKGTGRTVIVKHGNYFTVYHNMDQLDVELNQKVSTKQSIGDIFYDVESGQCILQFSIWYMNKNENPELWLSN